MSLSNNFPAIKPSLLLDFANTKALDPRVTFTRSTTATYYDGVTTAMAEQNLLTYSEQFDNAIWLTGGTCTVTANSTAAPDGTTTADTITDNTANSYHGAYNNSVNTFSSQTVTASVYLKAGTNQYGYLGIYDGTNYNGVVADLTGGTITSTTGTLTSSSITSVGNGWYRVVITKTITATTYLLVGLSNAATPTFSSGRPAYVGTGTTIFAWGAQLEQRSSVTAYTATTTQAITNYIPVLQTAASGVPRFDHNPTTDESLGLLIEEQRTNLLTYSEQFDNAAWAKLNAGRIFSNETIAPDGTLTADKLYEGALSGFQNVWQSPSQSAITYAYSVYAKKGQNDRFAMFAGSPQALLLIDMTNWTVASSTNVVSSAITPVGNGWYRCTMVYTNTSSNSSQVGLNLVQIGTTNTYNYTGNGWNGMFIWGAQLEAGAFATSYIPTVASTVTRNADAASMTGTNFSSWYSAAEGTLFTDFVITRTGSNDMSAAIIQGANTNDSIYIYAQPQNSRFRGDVFVGSTAQCAFAYTAAGAPTSGTTYKAALAYKVNDFAMSINAATVSTDTSGTVPVVDRMAIGATAAVATFLNGTIKKIAYYPMRLTNAQLQALTS